MGHSVFESCARLRSRRKEKRLGGWLAAGCSKALCMERREMNIHVSQVSKLWGVGGICLLVS